MNTKVIVCDLDGTLAPSKSALEPSMARIIGEVLRTHRFAVISGGSYTQFQKQFISHLDCEDDVLPNLYLFPANGSVCYVYDSIHNAWQVYDEKMTEEERQKIIRSLEEAVAESGVDVSDPYGPLIEDRGGQVTFSGKGQEAPLDVKEVWDADREKRRKIVEILEKKIPEFEIRIGGATSIDVTHQGITKAYAIHKIEEILKIGVQDMVFIGDALYPGGNDESARETGVECISTSGPSETETILKAYIQ